MKNINKLVPIIILGLFISCQTDWIKDYEKIIEKSHKDFKVTKQADTLENSIIRTTIYSYESNGVSKLEVNFNKYNLFNNKTEYYKNDSLIFVEKVIATSPIISKREKEELEPVGEISERISYFKNENFGIEKIRRIKFYRDDVEKRNELKEIYEELKKLDFEIKEIGEKEYQDIQEMYERYSKY
jgi:hypothetical protein